MFRAVGFQSHRRLFRRPETKRLTWTVLSVQLGNPFGGFLGDFQTQESLAFAGFFNRIRDPKFVLDSFDKPGTHSSFGVSLPRWRGQSLGSDAFFSVFGSRELSYLHSSQSYSDEDYDSSEAGDSDFDFEGWRRRLKRFIQSDRQEMITKDNHDRQDLSYLGPLLKSLGLFGHMYAKVVVISKAPLPNYRPDLDDMRPQRVVVVYPEIMERVDSLLRRHLMQRRDPPCSDAAKEEYREQSLRDTKTQINAVGEEWMNEERLKRRSLGMKNKQSSWQELAEGQKMMSFRQTLPAWKERDNLLAAVAENQVLVVSGETGCGKTTQLPQYILESEIEEGRGASCNIICTQPRRISAVSVAERVAAERGEELGDSVGYKVRLEGKKSRDTSLLFCTSGILLRRLMQDPELLGVSHVLVDEIHERGMNEDFLLIVLKGLLSRRPGLRLVLMSATLNAELFSKYFDGAPMVHIPGFTYPVKAHFLEDVLPMIGHVLTPFNQIDDYGQDKQWKMAKQLRGGSRKSLVNTIADTAMRDQDFSDLHYEVRDSFSCWNPESLGFTVIEKLLCHIVKKEREGAVLVFLTGHEDISAMLEKLRKNPLLGKTDKVLPLGLHGSMATSEQKLIFSRAPLGIRKIVLATNMAETSITINDVVFVVDCGKAKETSYDALNNTPCLLPQWISRASARQRRGRAGRVQPGVCYHLYPKAVHDALHEYQTPELLRTPLQSLCLQIKSLGLCSIKEFLSNALQPPEHRTVHNAVELLKTIGALDDDEELTDLGRHLSTLPLEPRLGKMLLIGSIFGCLDPVLTIAAGLTTRDPFLMPLEKKDLANNSRFKFVEDDFSDHLGLVRAYNGWLKALSEGVGGDYCWKNFLSFQTLQGMKSLRGQFLELLADAGFKMDQSSQNSSDQDLVRGVICAGLYPGVASAVQKENSITFKTKEDGLVNLHQTSVNGQGPNLIFPWLVFNEKVKTGSVNIRDSTGVSDSILLLFGGEITRGRDPGQLRMQDGFLEFFMQKDVATMILMLREELDDLVQRKLEDPEMDIFREGKHLLEATMELIRGDQCDGTFVVGWKASNKSAGHRNENPSKAEDKDVKSLLQKFTQKGGKRTPPKYTTKEAPGGYQSTVIVGGMSFRGKPAPNKKQAEKNVSHMALDWLVQSGNSNSNGPDIDVNPAVSSEVLTKQKKLWFSSGAVSELCNKSKGVSKGGMPSRKKRKVEVAN